MRRRARQERYTLPPALAAFGLMLMFISVTMVPPIAVEMYYQDGDLDAFVDSFLVMLGVGLACWLPFREYRLEIRNRDGFMLVVAVWVAASLLAALPFLIADDPQLEFIDALFEAVSGLTTTGATVLPAVDELPHAFLYYRAQLNLLGGMGIVVLAVAVLPMFGIGGMQLYRAETPGPMKEDKLTPRITETAKRLSLVYAGLVLSCILAYRLAGMDNFDAVAHGFSTIALGGFSTHSDSLGWFNSPAIELVAGIFSLLAAINFALHFLIWRQLDLRPILRDAEVRFFFWVMAALALLTCIWLYGSGTFGLWEAFYHGLFQSLSLVTDNGLTSGGYPTTWPAPLVLMLIMGSFFGGTVGSTCGGIKAMRFLVLAKQSLRELRLLMHPRGSFVIKLGERPLPERAVEAVWGFYFLYVFVYCVLSLAVAATGLDLVSAFASVAAAQNNMGVGYGETASHFGSINAAAKGLLVIAMLLGRLELFPLFLMAMPEFWRR